MGDTSSSSSQFQNVLIGNSKSIQELRKRIARIAPFDSPVLITGEAGSGKNLVAHLIHENSPRSDKPFVELNLAALPNGLAESELMGHIKGAFSGATQMRKGIFESANGGTIFLDELEHTTFDVQALILNIIESKAIRRIGENIKRDIDVRIIASARSDLNQLVRNDKMREDLIHRLATIILHVPPLRDRSEDVPELIDYYVAKIQLDLHKQTKFNKKALTKLQSYDYPGNIRELVSIVERAIVLSSDNIIKLEDLNLVDKSKPIEKSDSLAQKIEIESLRNELDFIRRNTISANPIWEGKSFHVEIDYCFVLMPFSDTNDVQDVYQDHVKKVLEHRCGLRCARADDIYDISGVMQSVWEGINRACLIIADLTGRNPNVFYELGIAHTLGKPVIMLTPSMEFVPFDLPHLRSIVYEYKPANIGKLEEALERTVKRVLTSTFPSHRLSHE